MNGRNQGGRGTGGGQGQGGGMGQGQGVGGRGRMGGPSAGGAVGTCRCPQCGHTEPHERGVPCTQVKCPQCGTSMFRE